ncbi:MAG TPA: TM2 domain-containing protein [Bacteroidales bacterium]|nr:TM2 domain-containing protein [Bacteroidales bacterium]
MESKNVEMFLLTSAKYFPSESISVVKEKLEKLSEDKAVLLHSLQFKDPTMMLIISILIGTLGVDRFILGQTGLGVAKLLTCGGLGVWTIIDWFLIMGETRNVNLQKLSQLD